eukprot:gene2098-4103_t
MNLSRGRKLTRAIIRNVSNFRVCVVGSGPAGFYSAKYLIDSSPNIRVDIIDRLPTPFGLVRYGVAPDHPEVKSVMSDFTKVASDNRVRFLGNVTIGKDVKLSSLREMYSAVILAYGASTDKKLNIPGEDLSGVLSSREFVNWYNGHPEYQHIGKAVDLSNVRSVVIIGQGNVAIDCARILTKDTKELATTDIAARALAALNTSTIKDVHVTGRRGHVQAAFTIKELREISKLSSVNVKISPEEMARGMNPASTAEIIGARTRIVSLMETLSSHSIATATNPEASRNRNIHLRFLLAPVKILGDNKGRVSGVEFERTTLTGEASKQRAEGTGVKEIIPCELVLKSVGYSSVPIEGVPFDNKTKTVPHVYGRVIEQNVPSPSVSYPSSSTANTNDSVATIQTDPNIVPGLYVSGWLKRGPSGIIGSNITDAKETVCSLLDDITSGKIREVKEDPLAMHDIFYASRHAVDWKGHLLIDAKEREMGSALSPPKPREKIVDIDDLLKTACVNLSTTPAIARSGTAKSLGRKKDKTHGSMTMRSHVSFLCWTDFENSYGQKYWFYTP